MKKVFGLIAILFLMSIALTGCGGSHANLVFGNSNEMPKTLEGYRDFLVKTNRLKNNVTIPVSLADVAKRLNNKINQHCYNFELTHMNGQMLQRRESYRQIFNAKTAKLSDGKIFFAAQYKNGIGSKTIFVDGKGKEPEDGMFAYGVEFTDLGNNKTEARSYSPLMWGKITATVIKIAEDKLEGECPAASRLYPFANNFGTGPKLQFIGRDSEAKN